jgi:hypothetical protein
MLNKPMLKNTYPLHHAPRTAAIIARFFEVKAQDLA